MKRCPYCGADNRDESVQCYFCERDMRTWSNPPESRGGDTQPNRVSPSSPQTLPASYPPRIPPPVYSTPPAYIPPTTENPDSSAPNRLIPVLVGSLVVVFVCICAMAALTFTTASANAAARLRSGLSTQASGGLIDPTEPGPTPADVVLAPTPWPTFTPSPEDLPAPVPTVRPVPVQPGSAVKLLSPECASALDTLGKLTSQVSSQPTSLLDSGVRSELSTAMDAMSADCGSLDKISPVPGEVEGVQQNLSHASSEYQQAKQLFGEASQSWSPSKLLQAGQHLQQAGKYLDLAITGLNKIGK